ncbi:hypothetical protein ABPG77_009714 [Micractinium sp. CCAP 211/92]
MCSGLLLLASLLLLSSPRPSEAALSDVVGTVESIFGGGGSETSAPSNEQQQLGPLVVKSATALAYALAGGGGGALQLPAGPTNATLHRAGPHSLIIAFSPTEPGDGAAPVTDGSPGSSGNVSFLADWVYTSQAPVQLLDSFDQLVEGPGTQGTLADAAEQVMGGASLLHVTCTGQGPLAGGLALLCAPWAALQFPTANANAITFNSSWAGFNTQFCWSFAQLAVLQYTWPFNSSHPALASAASSAASDGGAGLGSLAMALSSIITADTISQAITIPNMPPSVPPDFSAATSQELGSLAPLGPEYEPAPSEYPVILGKTRDAVAAACFAFNPRGTEQYLPPAAVPGLPASRLHAASGADAIVAWNASSLTGIVVWLGSESKIDWLQDAITFFSDDFRPGNLSAVLPGVKVHRGFLNQFASLTTSPDSDANNITAVLLRLSGGQTPENLLITGHSLGAALSELCAVWASTVWPNATVLVANTGAPRVGDKGWEAEFTAVVGRAYRYVNHLDTVPELPPFDSFRQVPQGMWLRDDLVLLQDRPQLPQDLLTWNDHHCDQLYVPQILNATAVTVPGFIYTTGPA